MANLRSTFENKYDRAQWQNILREYFGVTTINQSPVNVAIKSNDYGATAVELGSFETDEQLLIGIYEINIPKKINLARNKKTIRDLLSLHYKNNVDGALVVFKQDNTKKWRFSYVTELKQNATHWKRYTYLLGEGERCKTASDRFEKIKVITTAKKALPIDVLNDAFSVEKMSNEFFDTYRKHYGKFTTYLTGEDENGKKAGASRVMNGFATYFPNETEVAKKNARDFVKKMMGRIVFLYFLEKKGWLGVPEASEWGEGDEFFMSNLIKDAKDPSIFYSEVLVPLFFDTLNTPRTDELFKIKASLFKTIAFNKLKIPYLNGGLFEEDGNTKNEKEKLKGLTFPEKLFYNTKATTESEFGLFQFLDQYNFTVDEDSKLDHTIAVDPEMMGHIFENLLEDNKEKGTFYTPKPIVEYMCQESLLEYLSTKLNADEELRKKLNVLIRVEGDGMEPLLEYLPAIVKALKEVKICDPAIGSGAFPMGMLMEIYHIMEKLSTYKIARDAWPIKQWDKDSHKIKLNIIQNNIYGVDIEKGAVDIARLRFWLSLIVDLEIPQALPNLDYKIVQGNSLLNELHINSNYKINVDIDWDIEAKATVASTQKLMDSIAKDLKVLNDKQKHYFEPSSDKKTITQQIRDLKVDILTNQIELDKIFYNNSAKGLTQAKLFGDDTEQVNLFNDEKNEKQDQDSRKHKLEVFNEALKHLKDLKKHPTKPLLFFNYELDFADVMNPTINDKSGFDIVIGNPPYVGEKGNKTIFQPIKETTLGKFYNKKMDLFYYFFHQALNLTRKNSIITYITTNYYVTATGAIQLRTDLKDRSTILNFFNFNEYRIFESALGQHNLITILKNGVNKKFIANNKLVIKNELKSSEINQILSNPNCDSVKSYEIRNEDLYDGEKNYIRISGQNANTGSDPIQGVLSKVKNESLTLIDYCYVNQGLRTGADKVSPSHISKYNLKMPKGKGIFIINKKELDELNLNKQEKLKIKPLFKNSDIIKYSTKTKPDEYLIDIFYPFDKDISDQVYPNLLNHLKNFAPILKGRKENANGLDKAIAKGKYWFGAVRRKLDFDKEKIVCPQRSRTNVFGYNNCPWYSSADSYFVTPIDKTLNMKELLGVLNSKLIYSWLYNRGKRKGEYLELYQVPLSEIPIKLSNGNRISIVVNEIIKNIEEKKSTNTLELHLDSLIYKLYNLEYKEVKIIDSEFSLTEEEYEAIII